MCGDSNPPPKEVETVLLTKTVISAKHKPFQQADFRGRGLHKISNFPFSRKTQTPGKASTNDQEINWLPGSSQKVEDGWYLPFCSQRTAVPELPLAGLCMGRAEMT